MSNTTYEVLRSDQNGEAGEIARNRLLEVQDAADALERVLVAIGIVGTREVTPLDIYNETANNLRQQPVFPPEIESQVKVVQTDIARRDASFATEGVDAPDMGPEQVNDLNIWDREAK